MADLQLAPSYKNFRAFKATIKDIEEDEDLVGEEFGSVVEDSDKLGPVTNYNSRDKLYSMETILKPQCVPCAAQPMSDKQERFLQVHRNHGHISYARLCEMARQGTLPKEFATCKAPACAACLYSKATKRQWRHRAKRNEQVFKRNIETRRCCGG